MPKSVLLFDVNETLLDLKALDPQFQRMFGDAAVRTLWFGQLIQSAFVATITNAYTPFGIVGIAALDMLAARRGVTISEAYRQAIRDGMVHLPAHADVRGSLERLRDAGFRMAALTNSTAQVAEAQLTNAGIRDLFEYALSADTVKRLKPSPEPYHMAAKTMGVEIGQARLIATHAWDIAGAQRAGCKTAFVERPGMVLDPLVERPDVVGADMHEVAAQIIERDR